MDLRAWMAMTSMSGELEVFRTDRGGRVRVPVERREALMDEFEKSGMSGAEFARLAGVKYATFANWRQGRRKAPAGPDGLAASAVSEGGPVRIFEAVVEERGATHRMTGSGAGLLIELPGGGRARVESPLQLRLAAELLGMMAQRMNPKDSRRC
jgi:hypothetical protein